MFRWTEESIGWFRRAADRTVYYRRIAGHILDFCGPLETMADLGCGLAPQATHMSPPLKTLRAVDISSLVLQAIPEIPGMRIQREEADWQTWEPPEKPDLVYISYVGGVRERIGRLLGVSGRALAILAPAGGKEDAFQVSQWMDVEPSGPGRETSEHIGESLRTGGWDFREIPISEEFGQPFRDLREFYRFMDHYYGLPEEKIPAGYLKEVLKEDPEGYYLPYRKESVLFLLDRHVQPENKE